MVSTVQTPDSVAIRWNEKTGAYEAHREKPAHALEWYRDGTPARKFPKPNVPENAVLRRNLNGTLDEQ